MKRSTPKSSSPRVRVFDENAERYDRWFDDHPVTFRSEVEALRPLIPDGTRLEVGVGTGRFADALDIEAGVEPSPQMAKRARRRGIDVRSGVAEALPYADGSFDAVLMVTTICFVDDLAQSLLEVRRVLVPGGTLVVGLIDGDSALGKRYQERRGTSPFYETATFYSPEELLDELEAAGFAVVEVRQTLFGAAYDDPAPEPSRAGYGEGAFVAVAARSRGR